MAQALSAMSNRTLAFVALGAALVAVGLQAATFGIWGQNGDPPGAFVAVATVLFFGSLLTLLAVAVAVVAVRRRMASRHP